jgi:hypothetical protein
VADIQPTGTIAEHGWVFSMLEHAKYSAALVYHEAIAIERDFSKWKTDNPALAATLYKGVQYCFKLLEADGLPTRDVWLITTTVEAALKMLAAMDSTVPSLPPAPPAPAT